MRDKHLLPHQTKGKKPNVSQENYSNYKNLALFFRFYLKKN